MRPDEQTPWLKYSQPVLTCRVCRKSSQITTANKQTACCPSLYATVCQPQCRQVPAARTREPRRSHATPLLRKLHWLPVQQRIVYKVAVLTFKVRSTSTPLYLRRLITSTSSRTTPANRAFRCSAPAVWNSLPKTVVDSDSVAVFKSKLKTFLLSQAYSLSSSHSY